VQVSGTAVREDGVRDVQPIPAKERRGRGGGTAAKRRAHALRAVKQFAWLEVGSGKVELSRPAPPDRACRDHQYP
jgi:hypothetical protein